MTLRGPYLDLSEYAFPVGGKDVFNNEKPVTLEIGFGEGEFLIDQARSDATRNYLGLEIKAGRFRKAVRAAEKLGLENLKFAHMEAQMAAKQIFAENMFELVVVNFPDPWPKRRHLKHRMFGPRFIEALSRVLEKNARAVIRTDHLEYIEKTAEEFASSGLFRSVHSPPGFAEDPVPRARTKFEKMFREDSQEIYAAAFVNFAG